jgi:carbonic anhydrase/acetyltransferase-like protein (isoleucine patch superfamily)
MVARTHQERPLAIYQLGDIAPRLADDAFVADSAQVIGRVVMEPGSSVWYGVIIRGDTDCITIGRNSNVQDGTVMHADPGVPLTLGDNVTVGHQCMLHGCTVGDGTLIGIQAVVLNGAKIGKNCLVGAGALVTEGKEFPDNSLILGAPARRVKEISPEQAAMLSHAAQHYVDNAKLHRTQLKKLA